MPKVSENPVLQKKPLDRSFYKLGTTLYLMLNRGVFALLLGLFLISFGFALDAEISTSIDGEGGNFILETSAVSSSGFDVYDVEVPSFPDYNYAQLSSVVSGRNLMLDSFEDETDRTINLVYEVGSSVNESEDISFTWSTDDFAGYEATLKDCRDDSSWGSCGHGDVDLDSDPDGVYTSVNSYSNRYYQIVLDYGGTGISDGGGGSGGGGGGGGGGVAADTEISFEPSELNFNLALGRTKEVEILVTNLGDTPKDVSFSQTNLNGIVIFDQSTVEFAPGESKEIIVRFVAPSETGVYAGKLLIEGNELLTTINVRSSELLFDAMVVVPEDFKKVNSGRKLSTQVTLIPMGDTGEGVDVTLNYVIKDFEGNVYFIESETIFITDQESFKKDFNTNNLVNGNYLVSLELVYPDGIATSSSHFSIVDRTVSLGKEIIILTGLILVVLVVLIIWRITLTTNTRKRRKKKK